MGAGSSGMSAGSARINHPIRRHRLARESGGKGLSGISLILDSTGRRAMEKAIRKEAWERFKEQVPKNSVVGNMPLSSRYPSGRS